MTTDGELDYALTRVHARHGQRLDEAGWRQLEASRDLGHYLAAARSTALAAWVSSFDAGQDCHSMERSLRLQWRRYVDAVAAWHPAEWQDWLVWLGAVPDLSLLAQLARPEPAPAWMMLDSVWGPLAPGTVADRAAAAAHSSLAPLGPALTGRSTPRAAWSARWQAMLPSGHAHTRQCLGMLRKAAQRHEKALLQTTGSADSLRWQLAAQLQRLLRLAAGTVIVTLCHLALLALDLERLRGGLARRCLFGANQAARD